MTAVNWLLQELEKVNYHSTEAMIMYAKKLEKQQIIDAFGVGCQVESTRLIGYQEMAEQYYNETYGSKGSDETKTNNMKTGTSSLMDSHLVDFSNKNAHLIKSNSTTSSQKEISDEEIEKAWSIVETTHVDKWVSFKSMFIEGAKWYREQLCNRK